jgi:Putative transposase
LLERDTGNIYLTQEAEDTSDEDPSNQLLGSSITYRIAVGPQQGRKVFTLQTLPDCQSDNPFSSSVGEVAGFSLHAGVATKAYERAKLERLCRYITRPAVSTKRLSMTRNGRVRYELKTPWRNGTTHVIFEPLDFISRLVSLIPKPRVNLTRFHGVFAPNSKHRAQVTPARRIKVKKHRSHDVEQTPTERRVAMTWAQRLKRVFNIDIETCSECGGDIRIVASIEDPVVIQKILAHLDDNATSVATKLLPDCRASPIKGLFD